MNPKKAKVDVKNRLRKVDVNSLPKEQVDVLMEQLGEKVSKEFADLFGRLKPMLNTYGLDITLHYVIHPANETATEYLSRFNPELAPAEASESN